MKKKDLKNRKFIDKMLIIDLTASFLLFSHQFVQVNWMKTNK
jgi:hypothetical protein